MLNRVVLVGRLTKDPDLRYTPSGVAVATFTLAVNRPFKNQTGDQEADFINCVVWRRPAENAANFLKKGSLAGVDGRLQTRSYENQEGKRVYVTEVNAESVQFMEPKGSGQEQQDQQKEQKPQENKQPDALKDPFANDGQPIDISDDDLPF
ncbi:single-stranded DNA-binding protein [Jeotgalibacillus haloalkalitolerans]|uniref:Single-stranded DNA-binding protein n=1 Tax=Jeotgalibacillus haloalkalitolerans TaxID=3104292 RepID=A0ABU5KLL1_9BACL|nr:single-stranded DNA-binding protein [Jeotgalibacillus sp. HH7-29]MDZ5711631.1 single-stranded DNA-binding protein [Jeotgalibacillus sp. HH7-29]